MELQYISDALGNHTAVVIPIKDWEQLTHQYDELKKLESKSAKPKPSDFEGILPGETADAIQSMITESRENWS